jgi:predicted Rossmann-fold nucleotide-binding protein
VIDVDGYWQPLLALMDHIIAQGFADASLRNLFSVLDGVDALKAAMAAEGAAAAM